MPSPSPSRRVRGALLGALALSVALHVAWTFWPVDEPSAPDGTVLEATLTEMPAPPVPRVPPVSISTATPDPVVARPPTVRPAKRVARAVRPHTTVIESSVAGDSGDDSNGAGTAAESDSSPAQHARGAASDVYASATTLARADDALAAPPVVPPVAPLVVLPPRVDLVYKVYLGTHGFLIGDAAYRFEHDGDRYRISTVAKARGLAALLVRGTGKIESRGAITAEGLRPYEFAVERGSADRREVAFFDWDAGNVVLHDGTRATLDAPAFDPLTILWQPYFAPPSKSDQAFSLATTRRVERYTLKLEADETIAWPRGEIATERWHRLSEDGKTEAWFWLAPSMHYIPVKMRISRTARGTLEVVLDSIRVDADAAAIAKADAEAVANAARPAATTRRPTAFDPMSPPLEDAHGQ